MAPPSGSERSPSIMLFAEAMDLGGLQQCLLRLATGFAATGHAVSMVVQQGGGALLTLLPAEIEIIVLGTAGTASTLLPFARLLRRRPPDVLISGLPHANLLIIAAARLSRRRIRVIVSEHAPLGDLIRAHASWRYRILPALVRLFYPFADAVIAVSAGLAEELRGLLPARTRVQVIYNPVVPPDLMRRLAAPLDPTLLPDGEAPLIVAVGRLAPEKNFDLLIRAIAIVSAAQPVRLAILGDGSERPALERLVAELGLGAAVRLVGFVADPFPILAASAVLVLASSFEGFGNVLVEAMACGTPVVSTDCPYGPREILDQGRFGTLVPLNDAPALAHAITATLATSPDADRLKARARDFSLDRSVADYQAVIRSLGRSGPAFDPEPRPHDEKV